METFFFLLVGNSWQLNWPNSFASLFGKLPKVLSVTGDQRLSEIALSKGVCHNIKKPVQLEDLQNILHYINSRKQTLDNLSPYREDKHAIPESMSQLEDLPERIAWMNIVPKKKCFFLMQIKKQKRTNMEDFFFFFYRFYFYLR